MCQHKVQATHTAYTSHHVDEERLLARLGHLFAELLPEGHIGCQRAKDTSGKSCRLSLELEGLEAELNHVTKVLSGVDCVRADALHSDWGDGVPADELLGRPVAGVAAHRRLGKKGSNLVVNRILLAVRSHGVR